MTVYAGFLRLTLVGLFGFLALTASPASAGPHRARLSSDLAELLARGSNETVDVILTGSRTQVDILASRYNLKVKKRLRSGVVLEVTGGQLDALSQDPDVPSLSSDAIVRPTMAVTTEAIGADLVWAGLEGLGSFTGRGVGIAVIDSGISEHADLAKRVVASVDFTEPAGVGRDHYGHGTHVAGIIAGAPSDGGASVSQRYGGVAPGAHLINLRVLGTEGWGQASSVIEAIDWAIEYRVRYGIRVVNLSLGSPVLQSYRDDPVAQAVERAVTAGLVVVCSAGNLGKAADGTPLYGGIVSPGHTPSAITVGAINTHGTPQRSDDAVATYSSRGPTAIDELIKPDLVAPGNRIVSLEAVGSYLSRTYPERHVEGSGTHSYFQMSGTSMSAAVGSGAAALLLEANPTLTPVRVKVALQMTSTFLPEAGLLGGGAGSMNVLEAVEFVAYRGSEFPSDATGQETADGDSSESPGFWGNRILWGDRVVWGDTVVWGNRILWGDRVVWGDETLWADNAER